MRKPFTDPDPQTIDEQIEQILQTLPDPYADQDTCCVQDLQYLYRKEQVLAHAKQRLLIAEQPALPTTRTYQPGPTETTWQQHNTILSQPDRQARQKTLVWPKIAAALAAILKGTEAAFQNLLVTHP
jgi:hypothetical protein